MTEYLVRTKLSSTTGEPDHVRLLDWAPGSRTATIQTGDTGAAFLDGWKTTQAAEELMLLGAVVYCTDKVTRRRDAADGWTRQIALRFPAESVKQWPSEAFESALSFLTGDHWTIQPYAATHRPLAVTEDVEEMSGPPLGLGVDAVCLFSGGLDSLCGAIDLLEEAPDRRLCLLSHHEGGQASTAQQILLDALTAHYGQERFISRRFFLRPAPVNKHQARPLPRARENTTRSRSFLFLSVATALAAADGPATPVIVPENGFIGVNVPLTRARVGSASTRTTHPHFFERYETATAALGVANPLNNPYRLQTKGEMLARSRNPTLLRALAPLSVSCSHPETARYVGRRQGNCGYCFPCLIRRASLAHVGWDNTEYAYDVFSDADRELLLGGRSRRGADLRAVLMAASADAPDRDVLRNGPLPPGERAAFTAVWRRGLAELRSWLQSGNDKFGRVIGSAR
ncbi:hypothetical protein DMP17_44575 [Pseudonocardia sp. TMWB2A]|uniref:Qat anti-phage system QueC-like protein QatC n=1 Tax=Pseudonocardia sp. TMWB2A TaxID=687430 RepID=UPI00307E8E5A